MGSLSGAKLGIQKNTAVLFIHRVWGKKVLSTQQDPRVRALREKGIDRLVDASRVGGLLMSAGSVWNWLVERRERRHRVGAEWPGQVEGHTALAQLPSPVPGPACEVELKHSSSFLSFVESDVAHFLDVQEPGFKQWCCQEARKGLLPCAWSCPIPPYLLRPGQAILYAYLLESDVPLCHQPGCIPVDGPCFASHLKIQGHILTKQNWCGHQRTETGIARAANTLGSGNRCSGNLPFSSHSENSSQL